MQLRQKYSVAHMTLRLLEIIQSDDLEEFREDYQHEISPFQYWLSAEQFSRLKLNQRLKASASKMETQLYPKERNVRYFGL